MARGDHFKMTDDQKKKLSQLSSKYIAEEKATGKYPPKQAVAIGLNRARRELSLKKKPESSSKEPSKKERKKKPQTFGQWIDSIFK